MKRILLILSMPLLLAAQGKFDKKLSKDQQVVHVLNRLTFGTRPGDMEEVKRIGLEKWIDQQLHPARIAENPVLETKLQPFETLRMDSSEVIKGYPLIPPALMFRQTPLLDLLTQDQLHIVNTGTLEERKAVLAKLDPDKRKQVLANMSPQFAAFPELQVLGGPVRGKQVYGKWPGLVPEQLNEGRDLAVTTDFRDVLGELVRGHMGQKDLSQVFPGYEVGKPLGLLRT